MAFPRMIKVQQRFDAPQVDDIPGTVKAQIEGLNLSGKVKQGDTVAVTITAGETGLSCTACTLNGVALTGLTDNSDNTYTATYTVVEGHNDRAAGATPGSIQMEDGNGNANTAYTTI